MQPITGERIALALAIIVISATLFFASSPTRVVGDNVIIPTKTNFGLVSKPEQADATLHITAKKDIAAGKSIDIDVLNGVLSESKEQAKARSEFGIDAEVSRNRDFFDPAWKFPLSDFGTFGGYAPTRTTKEGSLIDGGFVAGLRFSPFRALYDVVAPDILLSPKTAGLGVSFYLPSDRFGGIFDHWGIGYGHLWPTDGGRSSNIWYLSFSTKSF